MATKLTITRENGNIPKSLPGEDHVSGFMMALPKDEITHIGLVCDTLYAFSSMDSVASAGLTAVKAEQSPIAYFVYHQLSEVFRLNPGVSLYVYFPGITNFLEPDGVAGRIVEMQRKAGGRIRQMAVFNNCYVNPQNPITELFTEDVVTQIQGAAEQLAAEGMPLSVLYGSRMQLASIRNFSTTGNERVSVVIAQENNATYNDICKGEDNRVRPPLVCLGTALGILSAAAVHECIAWVKKFPTGISNPLIVDEDGVKSVNDLDRAVLEELDKARFLYITTHVGVAGTYFNDSHTLDAATSDYAYIENVRTMDKAVRGVTAYLTPELGGNIYIDAESGTMQEYTVRHLETVAGRALEDMEKAGELSGYKVEIDPAQDVLANHTVEVCIKNVPVGVVRKINVKIGFVKSV